MRFILIALLLIGPAFSYAEALNLVWDKVTTDTAGQPITGVKYKLYRSANNNSFKIITTQKGNSFA